MKRATLDVLFAVGGIGLALLLLVLGLVMTSNANFVQNVPVQVWGAVGLAVLAALWMLVLAFRRR